MTKASKARRSRNRSSRGPAGRSPEPERGAVPHDKEEVAWWRRHPLFRFASKAGGAVGLAASLVSLVALACAAYFAAPSIRPPDVDRENPLALPFTISNDTWLTMYKVWPNCVLDYIDVGWMQPGNVESAGLERWGDLHPAEERQYVCPIATFERWKSLHMSLDVYYELHLVPWLPWGRHKIVHLQAAKDSQGGARFVPEYDITGRLGRPALPKPTHSPRWLSARRVPWDGLPTPDWDALEREPHAVHGILIGRPKEDVEREAAEQAGEYGPPPPGAR